MTEYVECEECHGGVPWYYAWMHGHIAMHPGCAKDRMDEEGCGPAWVHISNDGQEFCGLSPRAALTGGENGR